MISKMSTQSTQTSASKAFIKWAGGKSLFVDKILEYLPPTRLINTYYEPFLGAGSVYISYKPGRAVLSDLNLRLIETFKKVKASPREVHAHLKRSQKLNSKDYYYSQRELFNKKVAKFSAAQAARFIYLNKACFNGIYRVNAKGEFNVPFGHRDPICIPSLEELVEISRKLKKATLLAADYTEVAKDGKKNDAFYFDPPYPPLNKSSYFTHYTKDRFGKDDQISLAKVAKTLAKKGCFVLITNADTKEIKELYRGWFIKRIKRARVLTCSKKVRRVQELIITNYLPAVWEVSNDIGL